MNVAETVIIKRFEPVHAMAADTPPHPEAVLMTF
jgi:hypothetical protein